jgi:hypothetical protein
METFYAYCVFTVFYKNKMNKQPKSILCDEVLIRIVSDFGRYGRREKQGAVVSGRVNTAACSIGARA